jgi:hypothetical protein
MKIRKSVLWLVCLALVASLTLAPLNALAAKGRIYKSTASGVRIR